MSISNTAQKRQTTDQLLFSQFEQWLPNKPYAQADAGGFLKIISKKQAAKYPRIQHNPPAMVHWLTFDLDHQNPMIYDDVGLPMPNMMVRNPDNLRCHLSYAIEPVCRTEAAKIKPLNYLSAIQHAYTEQLQADHAYTGFITKNPLYKGWHFLGNHTHVFTLGELADHVDLTQLPKYWTRRRAANDDHAGLGRNCALFHRLRYWAYDHVTHWRSTSNYNPWMQEVLAKAEAFNTFAQPLPYGEIKSTAKSVGKWVWTKYTGTGSGKRRGVMAEQFAQSQIDLDLTARQRLGARQSHQIRKDKTEEKIIHAIGVLTAQGHKVTKAAVSRITGLSDRCLRKDWKHLFMD